MIIFLVILSLLLSVGALALLFLILKHLRGVKRSLRRQLSQQEMIVPFLWSVTQLEKMLPKGIVLPTWNHWSMPPDTLHYVMQNILDKKPKRVVEFGAGISTICIGALLKQQGGTLTSLEHDESYAKIKRAEIERAGLSDIVEVRVAPIIIGAPNPFGHPWYDIAVIEDLQNIDLVLVDGPPLKYGEEVRYPGIASMLARLSPNGQIICDDASRPGEQNAKAAILKEFPNVEIQEPPMSRGCFVIRYNSPQEQTGG